MTDWNERIIISRDAAYLGFSGVISGIGNPIDGNSLVIDVMRVLPKLPEE